MLQFPSFAFWNFTEIFFPQIFSIHGWLKPMDVKPQIQRADCTFPVKKKNKDL